MQKALYKDGDTDGFVFVTSEDEHNYYGRYYVAKRGIRGLYQKRGQIRLIYTVELSDKLWVKKMHSWWEVPIEDLPPNFLKSS